MSIRWNKRFSNQCESFDIWTLSQKSFNSPIFRRWRHFQVSTRTLGIKPSFLGRHFCSIGEVFGKYNYINYSKTLAGDRHDCSLLNLGASPISKKHFGGEVSNNFIRFSLAKSNSRNLRTSSKNEDSFMNIDFNEELSNLLEAMTPNTRKLAQGVIQSNRTSLARAITLVESTRDDHRAQAEYLLDYVQLYRSLYKKKEERLGEITWQSPQNETKDEKGMKSTFSRQIRVGIAGPPGAGKSTFIEAFGTYLINELDLKVAVIAIDPSSTRSGGSILGDKTRMQELSRNPQAFVRPSPTGGVLGGVARYTYDAVNLCLAGGYDIVLIETVGLGQSEVSVEYTCDMMMLLMPPAAGDELQGVKKGIVEIADLIVVNKADGDLLTPAQHTAASYNHALHFQRRRVEAWKPKVLLASALQAKGLDKIYETICKCRDTFEADGYLSKLHEQQSVYWTWQSVDDLFAKRVRRSVSVSELIRKGSQLRQKLVLGTCTPRAAAENIIDTFVKEYKQK